MAMSKRDVILLSVVINAGLLTLLLMTAIHQENKIVAPPLSQDVRSLPYTEMVEIIPSYATSELESTQIPDEVDEVLQSYSQYEERPQKTEDTVEITVKWGDALEKIAKSNGTSVAMIRKLNHLQSDRLQIGQVLLVPKSSAAKEIVNSPSVSLETPAEEAGSIYYQVQKGDNPWTIARRFHVSYTEILRLNALDEDSARNLRPGDKVRVK